MRPMRLAISRSASMNMRISPRQFAAIRIWWYIARSSGRWRIRSKTRRSIPTPRRTATAERELRDWKTAQFMEEHLGDEYQALIISVQKYGCFVELFEVFVEGLLPIGALEDAAGTRCVYREIDHAIVAVGGSERSGRGRGAGKSKQRMWSLGDKVKVRAERIDPMRHRVEFALLD